jgi:hypothetical protein
MPGLLCIFMPLYSRVASIFFFFFFTLEDMRGAELLNEIRVTAPFFALPLFRSPCPSSSSPFDFFFFFLRIGACVFLLLL